MLMIGGNGGSLNRILSHQIAMILFGWLLIFLLKTTTATVVYTSQNCNYTTFPKTGCEHEIGAECDAESNRCRCKMGREILYDNRFCFIKNCPFGQYYDEYQNVCVMQRRANPSVAESHCRYDFHCYGSHVRCKLYGWNRNCVCDPGFVYGYNGTCIPMHGIGGYCSTDTDCDDTGIRKMFCDMSSASDTTRNSGQCQCLSDHTYNYQVDGCESNERIAERKHNMRTLIILFVVLFIVFGLALTCNFGFLSTTTRQQQAILLKRLAEEKERQLRMELQRKQQSNTNVGDDDDGSAPPLEIISQENIVESENSSKSNDPKRLIAL
ncbi:hypothetical protein BLOT_011384 [Blomia tropicalis]|nr:hypothetical protein BLOT_011384 [Blomia tropicalis]